MPLCSRPGQRVAPKDFKHVHVCNAGLKTNVTVLACASAGGFVIPPFVIYQRKNLVESLVQGEIPGTIYGMNPKSGWMDGELFHEWFVNHFLKYAPTTRPLMLLLDGHASHYNPCFIREAASRGVIVFCLPPHATHACQPLDSNCFRILKKEWDKSCDLYMAQHPGKFVTIYQFSSVFAEAWQNAMTSKVIRASFKATGVYPLNRKAVDIPGAVNEKPLVTPTEKLAKRKGIKYIPFYSSPCAEKETKSPSPEESAVSDTEDVQICRTLFEEYNATEEDASGKTVREQPKECNLPEEGALGKTVMEEPKECNSPKEDALGKTVREEPTIVDDHNHFRSDDKVYIMACTICFVCIMLHIHTYFRIKVIAV